MPVSRGPADYAAWADYGRSVACFQSAVSQARYASAWARGDTEAVLHDLERIFTRAQRMPALNWVSRPDILAEVDLVEDLPQSLPEDWKDADFAVAHPSGETLHPSWLERAGAWDELLAATAGAFVFSSTGEKIKAVKQWRDAVAEASWRRPMQLSAMASAASRAEFLAVASASSPSVAALLGPGSVAATRDAAEPLRERCMAALRAWRAVTQKGDGPRLLTLEGLRCAQHVFQIDAYLAECTSPGTQALMRYLRCKNAAPKQPTN